MIPPRIPRAITISTRDLAALPGVEPLRRLLQAMALLDAILSPEWEYRYYSFNAHWGAGEQMGSMKDGGGDEFYALFNGAGCFLKGFAHEAPMTPYSCDPPRVWPGVLDGVPPEFAACLEEPAFDIGATTFCIWRRSSEDAPWRHGPIRFLSGPDPDGSADLLSPLDGQPRTYRRWAKEYFERPVPLRAVRHIYAHRPLTEPLVAALNPEVSLSDLEADSREIGYPS